MIQWLFFDVGYTLADETEVWRRRVREQADTQEARALGLTAEKIWREIEDASRQYQPQFRSVVAKYRFTQPAPYRGEWEQLYPGARELLCQLSRKYSLGVIANQARGLRERLAEWGILEYLPVAASSWEAGIMKPDPALFRYALAQAQCAPENAVMIGDRLDNDIFPAKALGMKTVWVRQGFGGLQSPRGPEYTPDWTVQALDEIKGIFL